MEQQSETDPLYLERTQWRTERDTLLARVKRLEIALANHKNANASQQSSAGATTPDLTVGTQAKVHGLVGRPDLNGLVVTLIKWVDSKQRWAVQGGVEDTEKLRVLPTNLERIATSKTNSFDESLGGRRAPSPAPVTIAASQPPPATAGSPRASQLNKAKASDATQQAHRKRETFVSLVARQLLARYNLDNRTEEIAGFACAPTQPTAEIFSRRFGTSTAHATALMTFFREDFNPSFLLAFSQSLLVSARGEGLPSPEAQGSTLACPLDTFRVYGTCTCAVTGAAVVFPLPRSCLQ